MKDFLTDEEMAQLDSPAAPSPQAPAQAPQGDFLTDEQMAQLSPNHPDEASAAPQGSGPVMSDEQMNRMEHPDHAAVNEMIRSAISRGMTKAQIIALAEANGVPNVDQLGSALDPALNWKKGHKDYTGSVDAWGDSNQSKPDIRTAPKNEVGVADAIGAGVGQGLTFGLADEIGAGVGAVSNSVAGMFDAGTGEDFADFYTRVRDENRDFLHDAEEQNGAAYMGGNIAGAIPTALVGGLGATGLRLAGRAALEGAAYGAGGSEADTVAGVAGDTALGGLAGGLTAGAMNRAGAVISPKVAPIVDRLMRAGIELTPTQIMKAGGPVARAIGHTVETIGKRGALTGEAMRGAEGRAFASRDALQAQQDAAVAAAKAAGLNATPRHPDLLTSADAILGKRSKEATQVEMLGNLLLGYGTSGGTLAADAGLAAAFTKPGSRVVNGALTKGVFGAGQGQVPKTIRSIATKLSPLAGNQAAINTPYTRN